MKINLSDDPQRYAGEALETLLNKYQGKAILLLLSGGSSLGLLSFVKAESLNEKITLGVVDERFSFDQAASNYLKLQSTDFYNSAIKAGSKILRPEIVEGVSGEVIANNWENDLRNWFKENPDGICLATIGIGPDGHIAGMFPGNWGVDFNGNAWTVFYSVPSTINPYTDRLTITSTFLKEKVTETIVYAVGKDKQFVIEALIENKSALDPLPAKVLSQLKSVDFFTIG